MPECRDTYVTTCQPLNPPAFLPDCEHGWELGNGTAICATQQPSSIPLATTGGDPAVGLAVAGVVLVLAGAALAAEARARRGK